ncbi:MAG TPA: hypothetical protein VJQ54_02970 [Candidatus Sulfotelmatobacter sp.]|nr:hypothetical protein [Candidatus Sulfotelmatobacter sp.]
MNRRCESGTPSGSHTIRFRHANGLQARSSHAAAHGAPAVEKIASYGARKHPMVAEELGTSPTSQSPGIVAKQQCGRVPGSEATSVVVRVPRLGRGGDFGSDLASNL